MFGKKCSKCEKKINKSYDFCPFCGNNFKSEYHKEDYGFLGRNDIIEKNDPIRFENSFIDRLFKNAVRELPTMIKMIEKQMQNSIEKPKRIEEGLSKIPGNLKVQFFINGKKVLSEKKETSNTLSLKENNKISKGKMEKLMKLPKIEPKSKIRRLSEKIVYELIVPGVKDTGDILINQLENSIEIKAISKDRVYFKTLNISFPMLNYRLNKGNLVLEFKTKN